jgi:hypothetical protein
MTGKFKILLIFILGGMMFLYSTCTKQKLFKYITYEGYIHDQFGTPYQGMMITLQGCEALRGSHSQCNPYGMGTIYTDAAGKFNFHVKAASSGRYQVLIDGAWNPGSTNDWISESDLKSDKWTKISYH